MNNIKIYKSEKYCSDKYKEVDENIYITSYNNKNSYKLKGVKDIDVLKKLTARFFNKVKWVESDSESEKSFYITYLDGKKYYKYKNKKDKTIFESDDNDSYIYVISISFVQEPEYGENNSSNPVISQYPIEDICDRFNCFCSDYYEKENSENNELSYVEFASVNLNNIKKLKSIIGKHVYNQKDNDTIKLVIE